MSAARGIARRPWRAVLLVPLLFGCRAELSFKKLVFEDVAVEQVFAACEEQVRRHYSGLVIRADPENLSIETDPVEYSGRDGALRQQVYVDLLVLEDAAIEVAVMVPVSKLVVQPDEPNPYRWQVLGSDLRVEQILLEEITGAVLLAQPRGSVRDD